MTRTSPEVLHALNHNLHKSPIVESSTRRIERISGRRPGNAEHKIGSYVARLEVMSANLDYRERLVDHIINQATVQADEIPNTYWDHVRQAARDNGQSLELSDEQKQYMIANIQEIQRESLRPWLDYFESTEDLYPMWFKVHALDAVTRLGGFDRDKGLFSRRSNGTTAPFPDLNPAVLAKTFKIIDDASRISEQTAADGNFNKVYSYVTLHESKTVEVPESPEDIEPEWIVYQPGQASQLANASVGTPWCIASTPTADRYLAYDGEFHLLHLKHPVTGVVSRSAVASIRLNKGQVAEISGILGGSRQNLHDALVPEVFEKLKQFPGGDHFFDILQDTKTLITMDQKAQAGIDFSIEELTFLYEIERPIARQRYSTPDPRIKELKQNGPQHIKLLEEVFGEEAENIVLAKSDINNLFAYFIEQGADIEDVAGRMDRKVFIKNIEYFLNAGLSPRFVVEDVGFTPDEIAASLPVLIKHDLPFEPLKTLDDLEGSQVVKYTRQFIEVGVSSEAIISRLGKKITSVNIRDLLSAGVDPNTLANAIPPRTFACFVNDFIDYGITIDIEEFIHTKLKPAETAQYIVKLQAAGANVDVNRLFKSLDYVTAAKQLPQLLKVEPNLDVTPMLATLKTKQVNRIRHWLRGAGISVPRRAR